MNTLKKNIEAEIWEILRIFQNKHKTEFLKSIKFCVLKMFRQYNAISKSNKLFLSLNGKLAKKQRNKRTSPMFDANIKSVRVYVCHQAL